MAGRPALLAAKIPNAHPDIFHAVSRADFDAAAANVDKQIPALSDHEIILAFARLVAMLGEGHTRLSLPGQSETMDPDGRESSAITPARFTAFSFHRLPIRLKLLSDGVFVTAAAPEFWNLLGAEVVGIGNRTTIDTLNEIRPLISRDNEMGFRLVAPQFATVPEILQALRIIPDSSSARLTFRTSAGQEITADLRPAGSEKLIEAPHPAYLREPQRHYWFENQLPSSTAYAKINAIADTPGLSFAAFSRSLLAAADSPVINRLILDFRGSPGGNNQLFRSLLLGLIRDTKIDQPGKLYVLVDRGTFSAAMNAVSDLERLTNAIVIGEETGGAPSSWGDPKRVTLPNSGLVVRLSSVYWRDSTPDASKPSIVPDIPAGLSSRDYFAGRDPALEAANRFPQQSSFADLVENLLKAGGGPASIRRMYIQRRTDSAWVGESTRDGVQRLGAYLLARKSWQAAFAAFSLNFRDYPDSLALAIRTAQTAQGQHPEDKGAADLVRQLTALRDRH